LPELPLYIVKDYTEVYKPIMQFNKNKTAFIHQWYPFVEGYSKEFITNILEEIDYEPQFALDPFAGSGTTPVELQEIGINCYSFEVSPFMHLLAAVKLERNYNLLDFTDHFITVGNFLKSDLQPIRKFLLPPIAKTFQKQKGLEKWVFNTNVMNGILDIKYSISLVSDEKYRKLFSIALASILLDVSNVYRNGKCLSYKKNWLERKYSRRDVHQFFLDKLSNIFQPDIEKLEKLTSTVKNINYCMRGDVRRLISSIPDKSIDLVITSPPYLNSRDYTDIYMAELWILDLVKSYEELKELRHKTFISHVQVKHGLIETLDIPELKNVLEKLNLKKTVFWNSALPTMIKGYFKDMDTLFAELKLKMQPNKKLFFNVANSAYYGVEIKVDEIVSAIAEKHGFVINEIREARHLKPSGQQKEMIKSLRESVIVMTSSFQ
jgi:DNA modification methylase